MCFWRYHLLAGQENGIRDERKRNMINKHKNEKKKSRKQNVKSK